MPTLRLYFIAVMFLGITSAVVFPASAPSSGAPPIIGAPGDPATINAVSNRIKAQVAEQQVDVQNKLTLASAELAHAQAEHHLALVRYLEEQRAILRKEWDDILQQQSRINRLIENIRVDMILIERIRMGRTDGPVFNSMIKLMAGAIEFAAMREAFARPVADLPADNFIPNDDEDGTAVPAKAFPKADVRRLLLFVKKNNFSFDPLNDAHYIVLDALSTVTGDAARRVLALEQEIQTIRASRISEVFAHPPQQ